MSEASHDTHHSSDDAPSEPLHEPGSDLSTSKGVIVDEFGKPYVKAGNAKNPKRDIARTLLRRLRISNRLNMFLTAIIAGSTVAQTVNSCNENASATQQVARIICAANRIGTAAASFSGSASGIKDEISDAEGDFSTMAGNSSKAIAATQDAMRQDQRAWVGVTQVEGLPEVGKPFHVTVTLMNTGRTPAINLRAQARMIPLSGFKQFFPDWNAKSLGVNSRTALFPNQHTTLIAKGSDQDIAADQASLNVLNAGIIKAYVFGVACYDDVFKRKHWSHFCDVYDPANKGFSACATFNEVDSEKTAAQESCEHSSAK